jgi:hypothetical protein
MSHSVRIADTARPLTGEIVEVPAHIQTPSTYTPTGRERKLRVGQIIEELPTLVVVQFFGYPHPWDYSRREAGEFTLAAAIP